MSYIEREAVNALIEAECSPKVAAFLNHAIDNIPAADAIEILETDYDASTDIMKHQTEYIEELERERDSANEAATALYGALPKWIPVTERLPKSVCKSYLCLTDTGYHCEARWTNNVYGLWKSDNEWGWSIADVPQYSKVTHWMPLPQPPEEET